MSQAILEEEADDRLEGSIDRQLLKFALWPLLENLLNYVVTATALLIATRMASNATEQAAFADGMGAVAYIAWFGLLLQGSISMGASTIVARLTGGKDPASANHAAAQGVIMGALAGLLSCALILLLLDYTLDNLLKLSSTAREFARTYMWLMAFSYPISGAVMACNAALRGSGNTRTPFLVMLAVDVTNALLALLLVWGPKSMGFGWGAAGLGSAAIFGYALGLVLLAFRCVRTHARTGGKPVTGELVPGLRNMIPDWKMQWRLLRIGIPQAVEMLGVFLIHFYVIAVISRLPATGALGAHTITVRTEGLAYMPGFAIGAAVAVLVGQYLGRGEPEKARQAVMVALKYAVLIMTTMGLLFVIAPQFFVAIFAPKGDVLQDQAALLLRIAGFSEPFFAACLALKFALRGAGDTTRVMLRSYLSTGFFRVVLIAAWEGLAMRGHVPPVNLPGIWVLFGLDLVAQTVIFWRMYRQGKWVGMRV